MMMKWFLILLIVGVGVAQMGSLQVIPLTATLSTLANYRVSYYTVRSLPANAYFVIDLSQTYIVLPGSAINATATVQNAAVNGATASCAASKCTLRLNNAVNAFSNLTITIGQLTNPYFLRSQ